MGHMTADQFKILFRTTLTDPRAGGRGVIGLDWPPQTLWMILMLMAVVLSLLLSSLFHLAPMPPDDLGQLVKLSPAYSAPLVFAVINWGQSVFIVYVLHWTGQFMGSRGELRDMLAVMIWLQVMTVGIWVFVVLVSLVLPMIGVLLMIVSLGWGIWAVIALVDAATKFDNMLKSLGVCAVAFVVFTIGMAFISALVSGMLGGRA